MTNYAALLRGVNVGGRTIKSAELTKCFEKCELTHVQTILASGNIIFQSDKSAPTLKTTVEEALSKTFKYPAQICVVSIEQLKKIIAAFPFKDAGVEFHRYVVFKDDKPDAKALAAMKLNDKIEAVKAGDRVIYWRVLKGKTLESDFAKATAKEMAKNFSTTRNLNTLEKIIAKV